MAASPAMTSTTSVKASKTWVLPPRPKPGRKSKKDLAAAAAAAVKAVNPIEEDDEMDDEAEKAVNRTKQKASRERKQEYIAELEAKVRTYEQGDGERASFFQGLAKTYSDQNAALTKENEELRKKLALYESGQIAPAYSSSSANGPSPKPLLTRKASSDLSSSTTLRGNIKRQRTKSISSNASSSSNYHTTTTNASASSSTSLSSAHSNMTAATSKTVIPAYYQPASSRSPAAMIIPSPTMSMSMHATPSPAASTSSYIPPSPPVSLGLSPNDSSSYTTVRQRKKTHSSSGCGVCDSTRGGSCICQDIGLRSSGHDHQQAEEEDELDETDFRDLNLLPSSSGMPSELDRCGFCTESTTGACLCAEVGMRGNTSQSTYRPIIKAPTLAHRGEHADTLSPLPPSRFGATISPTALNATAISNIPPGTTSVRLRLPKRGIAVGQIWRIDTNTLPASQQQQSLVLKQDQLSTGQQRHPAAAAGVALRRKLIKVGSRLPCSGDPKTCLACADDPAGQAFCSALSNTVCSGAGCTNCPNRPSPLSNEVAKSASGASSTMPTRPSSPYTVPASDAFTAVTTASLPTLRRRDSSARDEIPHAMIPCSDAWATLREHPNIGYANLDMLASVVAKRTQCVLDQKLDKDGKILEVEQQGVEEALDLLDHMRDVEIAKAKIDAI